MLRCPNAYYELWALQKSHTNTKSQQTKIAQFFALNFPFRVRLNCFSMIQVFVFMSLFVFIEPFA